jgi:hypothetical protein
MEYKLKENEMLLKVRSDEMGFLTKLNKDGTTPVAFKNWKDGYYSTCALETKIVEEIPREGWEIVDWRSGKSQTWIVVKHPNDFKLEIRMDNFMDDVLPFVTEGKKILGKWKFDGKSSLIK